MTRVSMSSRFAAALAGSALMRGTVRLMGRAWSAVTAATSPLKPLPDADQEDAAALRALWLNSWLTRPVVFAANAAADAWDRSVLAHRLRDIRDRRRALPRATVFHALGIFVLAAVLSETAVSAFDPRPVSPWRWLLTGIAIATGALLTGCARQIAAAWESQRAARF
jgi:hypothetical protein